MNVLSVLLFSFALLTDLHISENSTQPLTDLQTTVADINAQEGIDFVIVSGDLSEGGTRNELTNVKQALDGLKVPYHACSGNHETTWSISGVMDFTRVFGSSRFECSYGGVYFIGFNSGPVIRMADGHVAPQDIQWLKTKLDSVRAIGNMPIIAVTHYPLQNGDVDNWFDVTDVLRQYNVQCIVGGHYHRNLLNNCDGIADVLCRSNLKAKAPINGYTIISVGQDSIRFAEKTCGGAASQWLSLPFETKHYGPSDPALRPDYTMNKTYANVKETWHRKLKGGIYSTPVSDGERLYIGDDIGSLYAIQLKSGKILWEFPTHMRIVGSPAVGNGVVVVGSANDTIYGVDARTGKERWNIPTVQAVMGAALIENGIAYIGAGDGQMRAIDVQTGKIVWTYDQLGDYMLTRPTIYDNKLYFGCWDSYFYALNIADGSLVWRWNNGSTYDKLSPAVVWPVVAHDHVFITAPDRYFTCLHAQTGEQIWRTRRYKVRETVGLSEDLSTVYSKCMWDTVVAVDATTPDFRVKWAAHVGFGYEHNPCMPVEKGGTLWVGTKNGALYGLDPKDGAVLWSHKIGNSILNTPLVLSGKECVVTSSEGTITRVTVR